MPLLSITTVGVFASLPEFWGSKKGVPVFQFLKDPITRVYGEVFYQEMELVYEELLKLENS